MHTGGEERFDYLLDVAADLFLTKGFAATSVGEIAAHAKASKSTFYSRFPTKEKLFTEVFRRRADEVFQGLTSILLPDADPRTVLFALGGWLIDRVLRPDSISILRLVYMESQHIPELGRIFYQLGPERACAQIADYFRNLVQRGFLRCDIDTSLAAEQFHDLLTGEMIRRCALSIEPPFTVEERAYRLQLAVELFIRAYGA